MAAMKPYTIAIVGASGSGKSTLAHALLEALADTGLSAVALPLDAYYRDLSHLSFAERDRENFDHPAALELELVREHLGQLRNGVAIEAPVYDFSTHTRTSATQPIPLADVVIVEGILALAEPALADFYDLTVFVEAPLDLCLQRRIERDGRERGRSEASVRDFWFERVLPMYEAFGTPARDRADIAVDGTLDARHGVASVLDHVRQFGPLG